MSTKRCRLLQSPPATGSWNMAVDEALLESATLSGEAVLRFYRWSEPTLSLGYFQRLEDRHQHAESAHCPVVRRATGGGAIVHDNELTYSLVLSRDGFNAKRMEQLYTRVHTGLVSTLAAFDVIAEIYTEPRPTPGPGSSFLCFKRLTPGDVVSAGHKIAGSAQRRRGGAILQHGSILLEKSAAAPQLPGIYEISTQRLDTEAFIERLLSELCKNLSLAFEPGELTDLENQQAGHIERDRYVCDNWTSRR